MKRFLLLFFSILVLLQGVHAKQTVTIIADEGYPPYSFKRKGVGLVGVYIDIIKQVSSRMENFEIKLISRPWKRGLKDIEMGKEFGLIPPYHHYKKRPFIWPYTMPILNEEVVAVCRNEVVDTRDLSIYPDNFVGLRFGQNSGFPLGGDKFRKLVKEKKITIDEVKTTTQNLRKLKLKRNDCYINDRISISWEWGKLQKIEFKQDYFPPFKVVAVISREQGFIGITDRDNGKFSFKDKFLRDFNHVIYNMKKENMIKKITENFLKKDI